MAGFQSNNTANLTRTDVWSAQLQTIVEDQLMAQKYVRWLQNFPDGDKFHIPVVGQMEANDYIEGNSVEYTQMDTGDFTFQITEYIQSGTFITNKAKQDLFYANELVSSFVPRESRALMKRLEVDILRVGPKQQTQSDPNVINGIPHRWFGTGKDGAGTSNDTISLDDFARARLALEKANMPLENLIAFVDPSVEFTLNTLTNLTNVSFNPRWEGIITTGLGNGAVFKVNIYGFDVYISQNLPLQTQSETIFGRTKSGFVSNCFFSASADVTPIVGAIRQPPKVDSKYNQDRQREEFVTTMRYGVKLQREDNFVTVLTKNTVSDPAYV